MKAIKLFSVALLTAALGISGMAYAQDTGDAVHKEPEKKEWGDHHDHEMWSDLPEEKRKLLRDTMEKTHKENAALHEQMRKLHAQLDAIEVAPQFDSDAYLKKSAELDDLQNKMKDTRKQALVSILGQFTQEERVELVVMQHMMKMRKHQWHHADEKGWHNRGKMLHHGHDGNSPHAEERAE